MKIMSLKIRNFRNYEDETIQFDDGIQMIIGKNGQGKTNLLESIYYLSCTKSHRMKNDQNLIQKNHSFFHLDAMIQKKNKNIQIQCNVNENGKNLFLYKNPVHKVSDYIGMFNAILFCPDDLNLFSVAPKIRRKFIDLELGKLSITYTNTLNKYYKILKERNMYLRAEVIDDLFLETMDEQLINLQIKIMKQRNRFLENITKYSHDFYQKLSNDESNIKFQYMSDVLLDEDDEKVRVDLRLKYEKTKNRDLFLKQTSIGIHKDDFNFYINEHEVSSFASQGQKRVLILSLKLGIVYTIYQVLKEYPVLLLDDVFSELDEERRTKLLMLLPENIQIFISTTDLIQIDSYKKINYWIVEDGKIDIMRGK